jgi:hypothetical protein
MFRVTGTIVPVALVPFVLSPVGAFLFHAGPAVRADHARARDRSLKWIQWRDPGTNGVGTSFLN